MRKVRVICGLMLLSLLTACASYESTVTPVETPQKPVLSSKVKPKPTESAQKIESARFLPEAQSSVVLILATDSLTKLALSQFNAQQYHSEIATDERGLRIDRRAAPLYLPLAKSFMQLHQPQQAKNFTQQGLRYAAPESDVEFELLGLKDLLQE